MKIGLNFFFVTLVVVLKSSTTAVNTVDCNDNRFMTENACLQGAVVKVTKTYGRRMCIKECKKTKFCRSVNHIKPQMECQLNSAKKSVQNQLIPNVSCTYVEMDNLHTSCASPLEINTPLRDGTSRCIIGRCNTTFTVNNTEHSTSYQSVGSHVDLPCLNRSDGYSLIGVRRYVCMSDGRWALSEDKCKGFALKFFQNSSSSNWDQARQQCINDGGQLVITDTQEKFDAVSHAVAKRDDGSLARYFIGMNDKETEGTFKWIDGRTVAFNGWEDGQPNNFNNDQDCVGFYKSALKWNDFECYRKENFICEKIIV